MKKAGCMNISTPCYPKHEAKAAPSSYIRADAIKLITLRWWWCALISYLYVGKHFSTITWPLSVKFAFISTICIREAVWMSIHVNEYVCDSVCIWLCAWLCVCMCVYDPVYVCVCIHTHDHMLKNHLLIQTQQWWGCNTCTFYPSKACKQTGAKIFHMFALGPLRWWKHDFSWA